MSVTIRCQTAYGSTVTMELSEKAVSMLRPVIKDPSGRDAELEIANHLKCCANQLETALSYPDPLRTILLDALMGRRQAEG